MKIEFNETLKDRTINFCEDELNYHIHESGCADEYQDETCAEIELLYRLGEKSLAKAYKQEYLAAIKERIKEEYNHSYKKELKKMMETFEEFWNSLIA